MPTQRGRSEFRSEHRSHETDLRSSIAAFRLRHHRGRCAAGPDAGAFAAVNRAAGRERMMTTKAGRVDDADGDLPGSPADWGSAGTPS
jgi:hypothetical protein